MKALTGGWAPLFLPPRCLAAIRPPTFVRPGAMVKSHTVARAVRHPATFDPTKFWATPLVVHPAMSSQTRKSGRATGVRARLPSKRVPPVAAVSPLPPRLRFPQRIPLNPYGSVLLLHDQHGRLISVVVSLPDHAQRLVTEVDRVARVPVGDRRLQRRRVRGDAVDRLEPEQKSCHPHGEVCVTSRACSRPFTRSSTRTARKPRGRSSATCSAGPTSSPRRAG